MRCAVPSFRQWLRPRAYWPDARWTASVLRSAASPLLFGLRLWASLYAAFWLKLYNAFGPARPLRYRMCGRKSVIIRAAKGLF
jgi:hypothetical protein